LAVPLIRNKAKPDRNRTEHAIPGGTDIDLKIWLIVLLVASVLDVVTTTIGLRLGATEQNPLMAGLMQTWSEPVAYIFKALVVTYMVSLVLNARRRHRRIWPMMLVSALPTCYAVASNVELIARQIR
jgi:cytochrome bd-type quinol oxidase subunit 2